MEKPTHLFQRQCLLGGLEDHGMVPFRADERGVWLFPDVNVCLSFE